MSHLSIRKLPSEIEKAINMRARAKGISKTEIVIEALHEFFGLKREGRKRRDVRAFFGKMSPQQYKAFQKAMSSFSDIDNELWK